jgi:hypothetical protein
MNALIYTAIIGDYDDLKQPAAQSRPTDFVCFTDASTPSRVGAWQMIHVTRDLSTHPRMQAKRFKILSHHVLPPLGRSFDISIWVDASVQINGENFVRDMRAASTGFEWSMFAHPHRDCIYEEAAFSVQLGKYRSLPIIEQAESYRSVVPQHDGLYASTVIVRTEPAAECVMRANDLWWSENVTWSYQCQVSLPYVLRKIGACRPSVIPGALRRNPWFEINRENRPAE